jgi:hypothetical protein
MGGGNDVEWVCLVVVLSGLQQDACGKTDRDGQAKRR